MSQSRIAYRALVLVGGLCLLTAPAYAQATRTWVSGVGDDANPCSRTAPCKTFAGAISKTAAGGEIDVLDPGGFGAVTITKAISIEAEGVIAGVLVSGTNAIVVAAGVNDNVVLRGLTIEGLGTGLNGVRFISGNSLHVEDCTINNFTQNAVDFEPASPSPATAHLFVKNTVIRNNTTSGGGGVFVKPTVGFGAAASLDGVILDNNRFGVRAEDNSRVSIIRSSVANSATNGVMAVSAGGFAQVAVTDSQVTNTVNNGIKSDGAAAFVRISNVTINGNGSGLVAVNGGAIISFGNNSNHGNSITNGAPTSTVPQQ